MLTIRQAVQSAQRKVCFFFFRFCTCVEHLLDDNSHLSFQHGVEELDDEDETGAEDEQRQGQENEADGEVRQFDDGEEVLTCNG